MGNREGKPLLTSHHGEFDGEQLDPQNGSKLKNNIKNPYRCKLLMLGTGFSGKSTLYYQLTKKFFNLTIQGPNINYSHLDFIKTYSDHIIRNILIITAEVGRICMKNHLEEFKNPESLKYLDILIETIKKQDFQSVSQSLHQTKKYYPIIWEEEVMRKVFATKEGFDYFDGSEQFFFFFLKLFQVYFPKKHYKELQTTIMFQKTKMFYFAVKKQQE
jgi:hypothetical protein